MLALSATAETLRFSSGEGRVHLIELYSSEGCSSCPPAEAWVAGLADTPALWRDFVPVAFHVNYWDRLGWPDRFASKENTARQYAYASAWGSGSVYTPEFVLDGAEWRMSAQRTPPPHSAEKATVLKVDYDPTGTCRVNYAGSGENEVHVALLGGGIISEVRAGENQGRKLRHEFVVLALQSVALKDGIAAFSLPLPKDKEVARHALAAWVTRTGSLIPMQATGGWLE